jgi:ComEC/Rec2-related protein
MKVIRFLAYRIDQAGKTIKYYQNNTALFVSSNFILGILFIEIGYIAILITVVQIILARRSFRSILLVSFSILIGLCFAQNFKNNIIDEVEYYSENGQIDTEITIIELESKGTFTNNYVVSFPESYLFALFETPLDENHLPGEKFIVEASLSKITKDDFDTSYLNYLRSKRVYYKLNPSHYMKLQHNSFTIVLSKFKAQFEASISKKVSQKSSSLINGILLGSKDEIDKETKDSLNRTGTSHIISASGFNVIVVYLLLSKLSNVLPKNFVKILSIPLMILYVLFIGWYIFPARRALYMILMMMTATLFGRKISIYSAIVFSILTMLIEFPGYINNVSLQLSSVATLGLFLFYPKLNFLFQQTFKFSQEISSIISATFAASIATVPITLFTFGSISLVGILTNLLVLPLVPIIMLTGLFVALLNMVNLTIFATLLSILANLATLSMVNIVEKVASLEFASTTDQRMIVVFVVISILILLFSDYVFVNKKFKTTPHPNGGFSDNN